MYLDAHRPRSMIACSHLVQAQDLSCRIIKLIVIYLDVCKRGIKLDINITLPGRELECRHDERWGWGSLTRVSRYCWS